MKYQLITAASVLVFGLIVGSLLMVTNNPVNVKTALVERAKKADRLPLATFAERWDAVKGMEAAKFPALAAWLRDKGVIGDGAPVVASDR
jgi:hypothetical protein